MTRPSRALAASIVATALSAFVQDAAAYGQIDPEYHPTPIQGWSCVDSVPAPLADDSVFVEAFTIGANLLPASFGVAKFRADGSLDTGWSGGIAGIGAADRNRQGPRTLLPLANGGLIVVGSRLQRLHRDGSPDNSYGPGGFSEDVATPEASVQAALQPDGSVVILTTARIGAERTATTYFSRILPDGTHDWSFGDNGFMRIPDRGTVYAWSAMADGSVEIATYQSSGDGTIRPELHRYPADFAPGPYNGRMLPRLGLANWLSPTVNVDAEGGVVFALGKSDPSLFSPSGEAVGIYLVRFPAAEVTDVSFGGIASLVPLSGPFAGKSTNVHPTRLWRSPQGAWTVLAEVRQTGNIGFFPATFYRSVQAARFLSSGTRDPAFAQGADLGGNARYTQLNSGRLVNAPLDQRNCVLTRKLTDGEPRVEGVMVEYYHPVLQHYFMTLDTFETAILDTDVAHLGWIRTGETFGAWQPVEEPGTTPVCRFYGDPVIGPNSHFYTSEDFECEGLRALELRTPAGIPAWHLEGKPFRVKNTLDDRSCPANLNPVYRVFSGPASSAYGANHRYTADPAVYAKMLSQGWLAEGVHFCVPPPTLR